VSCLPRVIPRVYGNRAPRDSLTGQKTQLGDFSRKISAGIARLRIVKEVLRRAGFERVERLSNVGSSAVLDARSTGWNSVPTR
jgi:hypothetical protein